MTDLYDPQELLSWYQSHITRGDQETRGDSHFGFRRQRNMLPRKTAKGFQTVICVGAGCQTKLPFNFTYDHIETIRQRMEETRLAHDAKKDTALDERVILRQAMVEMELIVLREKLQNLDRNEHAACSVKGFNDYSARLTQDCVDQATNGTTYLCVLADSGLIKHHRIIYPGQMNIAFFQPHFFTRIKEIHTGHIFRFDLYHRGRFGIPPYVARI